MTANLPERAALQAKYPPAAGNGFSRKIVSEAGKKAAAKGCGMISSAVRAGLGAVSPNSL